MDAATAAREAAEEILEAPRIGPVKRTTAGGGAGGNRDPVATAYARMRAMGAKPAGKQRGRSGKAGDFNEKHSRTAGGRVGGGQFRKESEGERTKAEAGPPRSRKDVKLELERQMADKPKAGSVPENDPRFNWRSMGNGQRGVTLTSGEKVNVDGAQFDRLQKAGKIDAKATPRLRGDSPNDPDKVTADGTTSSPSSRGSSSSSSGSRSSAPRTSSGRTSRAKVDWQGDLSLGGRALAKGIGMDGKRGDRDVKQLQAKLQALGFDLGDAGIDGKFGPATEKALKQMQSDYGLKADGRAGLRTKRVLNLLGKAEQRGGDRSALSLDQEQLSEAAGVAEAMATVQLALAEAVDVTTEERAELKRRFPKGGVSLKRDARGVFAHTHRARSKSYPSVAAIPKSVLEFIESTG